MGLFSFSYISLVCFVKLCYDKHKLRVYFYFTGGFYGQKF